MLNYNDKHIQREWYYVYKWLKFKNKFVNGDIIDFYNKDNR